MSMTLIAQCGKSLDFGPSRTWPLALPALAWRGQLIAGFDRPQGFAVDLFESQHATLLEAFKAAYPELGLAELGRFALALEKTWPDLFVELRQGLFQAYQLRWSDRLEQTLRALNAAPADFQTWVNQKTLGPRDLAVLLATPTEFHPFLSALAQMNFSRGEGVRALELGADLFLMGRPLNDLMPSGDDRGKYLAQLEKWRRPNSLGSDEQWSQAVRLWPWPAHVQGKWQRFGDQSGLEVNIRSTSAQDFNKKLKSLLSIGDNWHDREV